MPAILPLALAFQVTVSVGVGGKKEDRQKVKADTELADEAPDSTNRRPPRRIPLTDALRASAFKDAGARDLLDRARAARMHQDSLLLSYDATSYQRISVGMSFKAIGRERLMFRHEQAERVQWQKDRGAWVEVKGLRTVVPMAGDADGDASFGGASVLPYYPGKEELWIGGNGLAKAQVDERQLVHPIAEGAEAYYTYRTGDSVIMTLPDGHRITLRELRIEAREPKWNVSVGSFWFDEETAHLVRAVYRLSVPMDVWAVAKSEDPKSMDDVPFWAKGMLSPLQFTLSVITIEYGLYNQRFWLPRTQGMEGVARVGFMHVPVSMDERFSYASVNGLDSLPKITGTPWRRPQALRDSLRKAGASEALQDSLVRVVRRERSDSLRKARDRQCATSGEYTVVRSRFNGALPIEMRIPCDSAKLANSPDLPLSVYAKGEQLFGENDRDQLVKALTFGLQAGWAPQPPRVDWGLAFTRYNRIEGLSTGFALRGVLGLGYTATLDARGSVADRQLNGDLTLDRSNGRSTIRGTVYRRLVAGNDWGTPLSLGASLASLLYARDEGQYYRTWGVELGGTHPRWGTLDWRLFAEQQWTADVASRWTLFGGGNDPRFIPNPAAQRTTEYGVSARVRSQWGLDPDGFRVMTDVRGEAGAGGFAYERGLFDATLSRGLGPLAAAVTASAGSSFGHLPSQRLFYLGGLQTVRGQTALAAAGDAFWLTRAELGTSSVGVRPVVFADWGWAGNRSNWSRPGRPLSGAGAGASFLDGLIRFDVARGLYPAKQWRADLYLEARF